MLSYSFSVFIVRSEFGRILLHIQHAALNLSYCCQFFFTCSVWFSIECWFFFCIFVFFAKVIRFDTHDTRLEKVRIFSYIFHAYIHSFSSQRQKILEPKEMWITDQRRWSFRRDALFKNRFAQMDWLKAHLQKRSKQRVLLLRLDCAKRHVLSNKFDSRDMLLNNPQRRSTGLVYLLKIPPSCKWIAALPVKIRKSMRLMEH